MKKPVTVLLLLRRVDCNDGVASYCETLVKGLNERGDRVVVVSGPVTQLYGSSLRYDGISQNVLDWIVIPELKGNKLKPAVIKSILAAIRKHSVDVISPQGLSLLPLAFLISKLTKRPVVANYHPSGGGSTPASVATGYPLKTKLGYRTLVALFRPARLIAISKEVADFYTDCGVSNRRIVLINNGIDTKAYRPATAAERQKARERFSIPDGSLVCELPGRLNLVKGHDIVIDAIRILRKARPELDIICLFPGGGDQAEEIKAYAFKDAADRRNFRFLGFVDFETLRDTLWASDIALLPSRFEGFAIAVIEAMGCGCVPIRTPSGGWREQIVDGSNGFIIPFNDPQALADRIAELSDPARRATLQKKAIEYVAEKFSQEKMITETSNLYRNALTSLSSRR